MKCYIKIEFGKKFLAYCGKGNEYGSGIVSIGRRTRLVSHNVVHYSDETKYSNETIGFETFETVTKQLRNNYETFETVTKTFETFISSMVKKLPKKSYGKI